MLGAWRECHHLSFLLLEVALLTVFTKMFPLLKVIRTVISGGNITPGTLYTQSGETNLFNTTTPSVMGPLYFTV